MALVTAEILRGRMAVFTIYTLCIVLKQLRVFTLAEEPRLTSYPLKAEEGLPFTLICTTTEKYIYYINWKRNNVDIFGMGPATGIAPTNADYELLKDRIVYSIEPGKQYNVTLKNIDPEEDHGSVWTCKVQDEDSNNLVIGVGDLPLPTNTLRQGTSSTTTATNFTTTASQGTRNEPPPPTTVLADGTSAVLTSDDPNGGGFSLDTGMLAAAGIGGIVILLVIGFIIAGIRRKRRRDDFYD